MGNNIANIKIKGLKKNKPKLISDTGFMLPFYLDNTTLTDLQEMNTFIKGVENLVRKNERYDYYIYYLKTEVGLNYWAILGLIQEDPDNEEDRGLIEEHHGPILTLYDYCSIVINHLLVNNIPFNSYMVADIILKEHYENNVQFVPLSKTVHQLVHANEIFVNIKQGFGNYANFLEKYDDGIDEHMRKIIAKNLEISSKYHSQADILDIKNKIVKW